MKRTLLVMGLMLAIPLALQAQEIEEDNNALNPEYSSQHVLADHLTQMFAYAPIFDIEGFQGALAAAIIEGWDWTEIYYAIQYSMFSQHEGVQGFYGCWLGYTSGAALVSFLSGPAGPGVFFGGTTSAAFLCALRHS
jgi:hypothetical protein